MVLWGSPIDRAARRSARGYHRDRLLSDCSSGESDGIDDFHRTNAVVVATGLRMSGSTSSGFDSSYCTSAQWLSPPTPRAPLHTPRRQLAVRASPLAPPPTRPAGSHPSLSNGGIVSGLRAASRADNDRQGLGQHRYGGRATRPADRPVADIRRAGSKRTSSCRIRVHRWRRSQGWDPTINLLSKR